jgi:hypothetical protein
MLASFQPSSDLHVALFSPQPLPPTKREFPVFEEVSPSGESGSAGVSPSQIPPADQDESSASAKRQRRAWAPDGDDHLIYQWVRLDGKGQEFVASCFGISQSTVSRIVERYERWQAHVAERDEGRLDPAERLRAQRWLAFERNEKMLASCLRLAGEMESCKDMSRSVTSRPLSDPTAESTVRTQWSVLDRTGMAARFLRLAFRINLEQLKMAEAAPAPLPAPLSEEEQAQQDAQAAAERVEIAAARERSGRELQATQVSLMDQMAAAQQELAEARRDAAQARKDAEAARREAEGATAGLSSSAQSTDGLPSDADGTGGPATRGTWVVAGEQEAGASGEADSCSRRELLTSGDVVCHAAPSRREGATLPEPQMHDLHNLHTEFGRKTGVSACSGDVCTAPPAEMKIASPGMHGLPRQRVADESAAANEQGRAAACPHHAPD